MKKNVCKIYEARGFTLMEILIYLSIIGVVVTSFISFGLSITANRNKVGAMEEVHANSRVALALISGKIREANGINASSSVFGSDPGFLSLAMSAAAANPTIIRLDQDNGRLQIVSGTDAPVAVTSSEVKITNLVFNDLAVSGKRKNIGFTFTIEYNGALSNDFKYSQTLKSAVSLRK